MSTAVLERPTYEDAVWGKEDEVSTASTPSGTASEDDVVQDNDRLLFDELADELAYAARGLSSTRLASDHPAYAEILAMGEKAIPWLLARLETPGDRPIWLRLLGSLTRFQPGAGKDTIPEAAAAWVTWGKLRHAS
jgi:hypothetical protein